MRDTENIVALIVLISVCLLVLGAATIGGLWAWQDAQDKRNCRQRSGAVVDVDRSTEWHCVGSTPERAP